MVALNTITFTQNSEFRLKTNTLEPIKPEIGPTSIDFFSLSQASEPETTTIESVKSNLQKISDKELQEAQDIPIGKPLELLEPSTAKPNSYFFVIDGFSNKIANIVGSENKGNKVKVSHGYYVSSLTIPDLKRAGNGLMVINTDTPLSQPGSIEPEEILKALKKVKELKQNGIEVTGINLSIGIEKLTQDSLMESLRRISGIYNLKNTDLVLNPNDSSVERNDKLEKIKKVREAYFQAGSEIISSIIKHIVELANEGVDFYIAAGNFREASEKNGGNGINLLALAQTDNNKVHIVGAARQNQSNGTKESAYYSQDAATSLAFIPTVTPVDNGFDINGDSVKDIDAQPLPENVLRLKGQNIKDYLIQNNDLKIYLEKRENFFSRLIGDFEKYKKSLQEKNKLIPVATAYSTGLFGIDGATAQNLTNQGFAYIDISGSYVFKTGQDGNINDIAPMFYQGSGSSYASPKQAGESELNQTLEQMPFNQLPNFNNFSPNNPPLPNQVSVTNEQKNYVIA